MVVKIIGTKGRGRAAGALRRALKYVLGEGQGAGRGDGGGGGPSAAVAVQDAAGTDPAPPIPILADPGAWIGLPTIFVAERGADLCADAAEEEGPATATPAAGAPAPDGATARAANYILDDRGQGGGRVAGWRVTNCLHEDPGSALWEIEQVQARNTRVKTDKHVHMVFSFAAGENPPREVLHEIEDRLMRAVGLEEHQRISAIHTDTEHLHVHVLANRIHPETARAAKMQHSHRALNAERRRIERDFGLVVAERDRGLDAVEPEREAGVGRETGDIEAMSGQQSLESWARERIAEPVREMLRDGKSGWDDLHALLAGHGLRIKPRGAGLVIESDAGVRVKPSSVSRDLSKASLERAFGKYEAPSAEIGPALQRERYERPPATAGAEGLWAEYQRERDAGWEARSRYWKRYQIEKRKVYQRFERRFAVLKVDPVRGPGRRLRYAQLRQERAEYLADVRGALQERLIGQPQTTWRGWLERKVDEGREDALAALRANQRGAERYARRIEAAAPEDFAHVVLDGVKRGKPSRSGSVRYYAPDGGIIVDDGRSVNVVGATDQALVVMLVLAERQHQGRALTIRGDDAFRARVAGLAGTLGREIRFADPAAELAREAARRAMQKRLAEAEVEKGHGRGD